MATENQLQLVKDIESAIAAIKMKNPDRPPDGLTITEVCEMSGRSAVEVRALVLRMSDNQEQELLKRLHESFLSVGLSPKYLASAVNPTANVASTSNAQIAPPEPLRLSRALPPTPAPFSDPDQRSVANGGMVSAPRPLAQNYPDPSEAVTQMIKMLAPLPERQRQRVIVSVSAYYGVGE